MLQTKDDESRLSAIWALKRIGPHAQAAVPSLIGLLRDSDVEVAFAVCYALGEIGNWAELACPGPHRIIE